ncbi:23063_t:CDS:1 [Rhizophagus irregularis]|nr:23063_t:CDS:1 [Rhizophagus irregularis]
MMDDDPKKLSKMIIDLISESDGYYYIYKDSYTSKKASDILTFRYKCSQCKSLAKRPRKNESIEKQRDRIPIERFNCNGLIKIKLKMGTNIASVNLQHSIIHKRLNDLV